MHLGTCTSAVEPGGGRHAVRQAAEPGSRRRGAGLGVEQKEGDQRGKKETKENLSKPNQTPDRLTSSQTQTASDTSVTCSTVRGGAPSSGGLPGKMF